MSFRTLIVFAVFTVIAFASEQAHAVFNSALGRWVTRDPLKVSSNLLEYAISNPMGFTDSHGLKAGEGIYKVCDECERDKTLEFDISENVLEGAASAHYRQMSWERAEDVYKQCCLKPNRVGPAAVWTHDMTHTALGPDLKLAIVATNSPPTQETLNLTAGQPLDKLNVYWIKGYTGPGSAGTKGVSFHLAKYNAPPACSSTVANPEEVDPSDLVLSHEMGHVLLDTGRHEDRSDNLMYGGWPMGDRLDEAQCNKIRSHALVHDPSFHDP